MAKQNIDDIENLLERIYDRIQYNHRRTPDGSHMTQKGINQEINKQSEVFRKSLEDLGKTQDEINKELKKFRKNLRNTLKEEARNDAWSAVTFGRSEQITRKADSMSSFGNGLSNIFGEKSAIGKFGQSFAKSGTSAKAMAGKISVATMAIEKLGEVVTETLEYIARQKRFDIKDEQLIFDRRKQLDIADADIEYQKRQFIQELLMRKINAQGAIAKEGAQFDAEQYVNSIKTSLGSVLNGTNETAYQAAMNAIDAGSAYKKFNLHKENIETKMEKENYASAIKNREDLNILEQQKNQAKTMFEIETGRNQFDREQDTNATIGKAGWGAATLAGAGIGATATSWSGPGAVAGGVIGAVVGGVGYGVQQAVQHVNKASDDLIRQVEQHETEYAVYKSQNEAKLFTQQAQNEKDVAVTRLENEMSIKETWIEGGKEVAKAYLELAKKTMNFMDEYDLKITKTGINMGIVDPTKLNDYKKSQLNIAKNMSTKWNRSEEDMMKVQSAYADNTGRNIHLSETDYDKAFAVSKLTGNEETTTQIISGMQIFNKSVADSSEMLGDVLDQVRKVGLNTSKFSKELASNLKLAQKYQFKGGVKGMMQMSKWAQEVRFNMNNFANVIETIQEGGLEGNITNAAKMQVLGGNFAMGADPLAMLFEGYNDPQALGERFHSMIDGIGYLDRETGQAKVNMQDQIRLKQFAKYSGQNYEDVLAQVYQNVNKEGVDKQLNGKYTKEQRALIAQNAHLNTKTNRWEITDELGNTKDINDLNDTDFAALLPHEQAVEDYLSRLVTIGEKISGGDKAQQLTLAESTLNEYFSTKEDMLKTSTDNFIRNFDKHRSKILESYGIISSSYEGYCQTAAQGNKEIDEMNQSVLSNAKDIAKVFTQANEILQGALIAMRNDDAEHPDVSNRNPQEAETKASKDRRLKELEEWYNNSEWEDDSFAELAYKLSAAKSKKDKHDIMADLKGDGWFDMREDGMEDWFNEQDVIDRWNYLVQKGRYSADGKKIKDGITNAHNVPMTVAASKVTPINDGEIATTSPQDHAIFAKTGGPFDKLFNGIFSKINAVYKSTNENEQFPETSIKELYRIAEIAKQNEVQPKPLPNIEMPVRDNGNINTRQEDNTPTVNNGTIKIEPITLNIKLDGVLGQSKDFMEELSKNPMMIRSLSQLISESINKNINGGKSSYTGGIPTSRFKGNNF